MDRIDSSAPGGSPSAEPELRTENRTVLDPTSASELRAVYLRAFETIKAYSLTRIVMTDDEWELAVVSNPDNVKIVGLVDGRCAGLLVVTNRPDKVDWLEPAFLERQWPEVMAARRLWYVLTICVDPLLPRTDLFRTLIRAFLDLIEGDHALYDTCTANTHLTRVITEELTKRGIDTSPLEQPVDTESFRTVPIVRSAQHEA